MRRAGVDPVGGKEGILERADARGEDVDLVVQRLGVGEHEPVALARGERALGTDGAAALLDAVTSHSQSDDVRLVIAHRERITCTGTRGCICDASKVTIGALRWDVSVL